MSGGLSVAMLHPDLGIGGAEQLVINMALSLQQQGHEVTIYTPLFDPTHCFAACLTPQLRIKRVRTLIPKWSKAVALWAYLRMYLVTLYVLLFGGRHDVYIVDQVSICVPILRMAGKKVLFYCHFPDKLLCTERSGRVKRVYRRVIDWVEESSLRWAHLVVMNSLFTKQICAQHYPSLHKIPQDVLYPAIELDRFSSKVDSQSVSKQPFFVSLNRYERKKNIALALKAFSLFTKDNIDQTILIVAGGYDPSLKENVEHKQELMDLSLELGIEQRVQFRTNVSDQERHGLLSQCIAVLYTPKDEHFGIVPVESMYCCSPVICDNSGGPKESVIQRETGLLIDGQEQEWAEAMVEVMKMGEERRMKMGQKGRERVIEQFGLISFGERADGLVRSVGRAKKE